jgi:hypothetical protein
VVYADCGTGDYGASILAADQSVRLSMPRRGGWRAWGSVSGDFRGVLPLAHPGALAPVCGCQPSGVNDGLSARLCDGEKDDYPEVTDVGCDGRTGAGGPGVAEGLAGDPSSAVHASRGDHSGGDTAVTARTRVTIRRRDGTRLAPMLTHDPEAIRVCADAAG